MGDKAKVRLFVSDVRTALSWIIDKLGDKAKVRLFVSDARTALS